MISRAHSSCGMTAHSQQVTTMVLRGKTTTALTATAASSRSISTMSRSRLAAAGGSLLRYSSGPVHHQRFASSSSSMFRRFDMKNSHRRRWSTSYTYTSSSYSSSSSSSSSSKKSSSSFSSFFGWYSNKLDTHPITTKCVSAGLISALGNVLAQAIAHYQERMEQDEKDELEYRRRREQQLQQQESMGYHTKKYDNTTTTNTDPPSSFVESPTPRKPFEVDLAQVSRFAFLNVAFVAPVLHHWYQFINRTVPGRSLSRVAQRVFWDEFVFSPMYIPVFLGMLWKLEGSSNDDVVKMTKSEVPAIILAEWALWVPGMFATFRFVPVKFQVLVINVIGVVWQTFLAYMASHAKNNASVVVEEVNVAEQKAVAKAQHLLDVVHHNDGGGEMKKKDDGATKPFHDPIVHGIPAGIVVEEKVVPLVLSTIVRKETPRYYEIDMTEESDD